MSHLDDAEKDLCDMVEVAAVHRSRLDEACGTWFFDALLAVRNKVRAALAEIEKRGET